MSSGGLQLTTGTSLPSGVRYEIHPLPIPTNQRLPWLSKAPPSRNLPCGVSLISANFSIGPTPCGKGGRPQGWTGPALGACAWALGTSPSGAMAQKRAIAPIDKEWSRRRRLGIAVPPRAYRTASQAGAIWRDPSRFPATSAPLILPALGEQIRRSHINRDSRHSPV